LHDYKLVSVTFSVTIYVTSVGPVVFVKIKVPAFKSEIVTVVSILFILYF